MSQIKTLLESAANIEAHKATAGAAASAKNAFSLQALYILHNGFMQDKIALERMTAKGGELFKCKSYVSKARSVLNALEQGASVEVSENETVSIETIEAHSFDNLPSFTLSTVYTTIKKEQKAQEDNARLDDLAFVAAVSVIEERLGQKLNELKKSMPERIDQIIEAEQAIQLEAIKAELATASELNACKALVDKLNAADIAALAEYVMDKLNVTTAESLEEKAA